jgi:hypothetical protein
MRPSAPAKNIGLTLDRAALKALDAHLHDAADDLDALDRARVAVRFALRPVRPHKRRNTQDPKREPEMLSVNSRVIGTSMCADLGVGTVTAVLGDRDMPLYRVHFDRHPDNAEYYCCTDYIRAMPEPKQASRSC